LKEHLLNRDGHHSGFRFLIGIGPLTTQPSASIASTMRAGHVSNLIKGQVRDKTFFT
jgi:hypothetical protein